LGVQYRIRALSPKPSVPAVPAIPFDWVWTIDLNGLAEQYVEFWKPRFLGGLQAPEIDAVALDAFATGYFLEVEPADPQPDGFACCYTAVLANENIPKACESLLQLGIRTRIVVSVRPRSRLLCSLAIGTSREASHVLGQFFPGLRRIPPKAFKAAEKGRLLRPLQLSALTIPILPGMDEATPLPLQIPSAVGLGPNAIHIGQVLSPYNSRPVRPALLPMDRMMRGVLVAGTTGGGKTNTVLRIIEELHAHAWVLVFDVKREYRTLHQTMGADVYGFRGRNILTHNLLKPVGPPDQWVKQFASILSEVIFNPSPAVGSKDVVIEELDKLYHERGVYESSTDYPHVGHLVAALEARASERGADRAKGWIASALRVLRSLMVGSTREAFCVREGVSLERLQQGINVVELDGIGDSAAQALLVSVLLQKLRNQRMGGPERERLEGLIVVEEAQHMLAQGSEATSVIATACREIRSQGIGLVFVTQLPADFSRNALANVNTLIFHRLVHPTDRSLALRLLGLEREGDAVLDGLDVGQALVRTDRVFLVQVPRQERPWVNDDELPDSTPPAARAVATSVPQRTEVSRRAANLSGPDLEVFNAIAEGRAIYQTGLAELLRMSGKDVGFVLTRLLHRGFVGYCRAKKRGPGQARNVFFLRPYGKEAYRQQKGRPHDRKTERSPDHGELLSQIVQVLGIIRKPHPTFDILHDEGEAERAIEAETGSNHDEQILKNLTKSIEFQGHARFVGADEVARNRILQVAASHAYDSRAAVTLELSTVSSLPAWAIYRVEVKGRDGDPM
jgi:DNA helicase HerA-like ATPase